MLHSLSAQQVGEEDMENKVVGSKIEIYTDGGCHPNPGDGAWAWWVNDECRSFGVERETTNNRMELKSIIQATKWGVGKAEHIYVLSDSSYCVQGINSWVSGWIEKKWKIRGGEVKNRDLWEELWFYSGKANFHYMWVKGHSGIPGNEAADELVKKAMKESFGIDSSNWQPTRKFLKKKRTFGY